MTASDWVFPIVVAFYLYWPVFAVGAILILGPLLGFVIVAVIGAIRAGVAGQEDEDTDATDELFGEFEELREGLGEGLGDELGDESREEFVTGRAAGRNDSI